jgi:hypothetical protein
MVGGLDNRAGQHVREQVYRVTHVLGFAARLTWKFVRFQYRVVKSWLLLRMTSPKELQATLARYGTVTSDIPRTRDHLQSTRHAVLISGRIIDSGAIPESREYVTGLSGTKAGEASEAFDRAMFDSNPGVRRFALGTVGEHAGEQVTILILDALNDPESSVRCAAVAAAAKAELSSAVFSLILLLADPVPHVAHEAKLAIEKITGRKVGLGPGSGASARLKKMRELRVWWKKKRLARLSAEVEAVIKT